MKKFTDRQLMIFEKEVIDCADYVLLLGECLDSDMPCALKNRLILHKEECKTCQKFEKEYKNVISIAKTLKEDYSEKEIPKDTQKRLRSFVKALASN